MRWPCGPLEVELRKKQGTLNQDLRETLEYWQSSSALEILDKTPVNCLVIRWAAGLLQDEEQQWSLKPLLETGRQTGLNFVGLVEGPAEKQSAIDKAADAGLSGLILADAGKSESRLPIIDSYKRSTLPKGSRSPLLVCEDAVWPRLRSTTITDTDSVVAGPTGVPWLDSNGWYVQLTRTLNQGNPIWLMFDPPKMTSPLQEEAYLLALADTEAYGARWMISLDDTLRSDLAARKPQALESWKNITNALRFFRNHPEWNAYRPKSFLAVVSDFTGSNEFLSGEVLNLLRRRQVGFSIVDKSQCMEASLGEVKAVLWVDQEPAGKELNAILMSFVQKGTLLIVPKTWRKAGGIPKGTQLDDRFEIFGIGKGRLARANKETDDPYQVAEETHLLLSRRNDLFRLWNAGTFNGYLTLSPDNKKSLLQLINYAGRNSPEPLSVWVKGSYSRARVWRHCSASASLVNAVPAQNGQEYHLPPVGFYAAIEMDNLF